MHAKTILPPSAAADWTKFTFWTDHVESRLAPSWCSLLTEMTNFPSSRLTKQLTGKLFLRFSVTTTASLKKCERAHCMILLSILTQQPKFCQFWKLRTMKPQKRWAKFTCYKNTCAHVPKWTINSTSFRTFMQRETIWDSVLDETWLFPHPANQTRTGQASWIWSPNNI